MTDQSTPKAQGLEFAKVTLPMCASEVGAPWAKISGGFTMSDPETDPAKIRRDALSALRAGGIKHHGTDLLPDAADPNPENWRVVCTDKGRSLWELHYQGLMA